MSFFICFCANAQKATVDLNPESSYEHEFINIYPVSNGNYLKLSYDIKAGVNVFGVSSNPSLTSFLSLCDHKFVEQKSVAIEDEKGYRPSYLRGLKGNYYIISSKFNKEEKSSEYSAQKYNTTTLDKEGTEINLGSFESTKGGNLFKQYSVDDKVTFKQSSDSSKMLLIASRNTDSKENEKYYLGVYNHLLKKMWDKTIEMPYPDKFVKILDYYVSNNGEVGVLIKHYDRDVMKESIKDNGVRVPAYSIKLLLYPADGSAEKELTISTNDKYVDDIKMSNENGNEAIFLGLYQSIDEGQINGYITITVNQKTKTVISNKIEAFSKEFINQIDVDGQGNNREKDAGLDFWFKIKKTNIRKNGSIDFLLEYKMTTGFASTLMYYIGDIIDINISTNGKTTYSRIPKMQIIAGSQLDACSFSFMNYENKLCVFYNDDRDNLNSDIKKKPSKCLTMLKTYFMMATIDENGNVIRDKILDNKESDSKICPTDCKPMGANKLFLYAKRMGFLSRTKDRMGFLTLQ